MDAGLLIRWGQVVPGREEQAMALFDEAVKYYLGLIEEGKLTSFEPYLFDTADLSTEAGFFILRAPVTELFQIMDSESYKTLTTKAMMLLEHLTINMLTVGDGIEQQLKLYDKARMELHL